MHIKKKILGLVLAITMVVSCLNSVPERVKADTSNPKAQAEVIPSPAKPSATMAIGATKQIKINNMKKTTKVTYKSDKPKTVKVSKKGKITALKAGRANISITVRTKTGEIKYGYAVIVKKPSFKQKKLNLIKGKSKTLKIKNISKQAKVTWKSSNKKVASVSAKGSIKAIKKGKADISAVIKVAGKTYTLKQRVTVNNKPTLVIKVSNKLYDKKKALIKTTDENIVIKGKITGKNKLRKLSITYTDHTNKPAKIKPSGKRNWSVNVPLSIGRTRVKITAEGKKKEKVTKVISINRTNKTIEYSTNVKIADIKEAKEVSDSVVKSFRDDNNTSDRVSDDTIVVLVKEDSELLRKINAGELQKGNAYVLPQVEHFIAGFTGIYNRHQAPRDSAYPDYAYEEVIFNYPTIDKLFDKDINLDFSGGIDKENPIAFTLIGNKATINPKVNGGQIGMTNKVRVMGYGDDDKYPSPGFQRKEFFEQLGTPKVSKSLKREEKPTAPTDGRSESEQSTGYDIKLNWEDVVIYDKDGVKNKDGDTSGEILLSGEIGVENLRHEGGIVWEKGEVSPKQLQSKVKFDFVDNLEIKGTVIGLTTEELVKTLNEGFENNKNVAGMNISGVETFKNKWVIGAVGIRLETKTFVAGDLNRIAEQSYDPTVMFFIFMDIDGKITVEGGIKSEKTSSFTLGFNLQKNDFEGSLGTLAENKGDDRFEVKDYTLDVYRNKKTERTTTVSGSMEADLTTGIGIGAGLMVFGISPAVITGEIYTQNKISAKLEGVLSLPDTANPKDKKMEMTGGGEIELLSEVGAKAEMEFRLAAEFGIWEKEVVYKKEWPDPADNKPEIFDYLTQKFSYKFGKEEEKEEKERKEGKGEQKKIKNDEKTKETFGSIAIKFKYDEVNRFSENMAAVKINGKWGFINEYGNEVIKPEYDAVDYFRNGLARVKLNKSWGFINKEGKIVIPIKYKFVSLFNEGLACAGGSGEGGYIDMSGNEIIPFKSYSNIGTFSRGLANVILDGRGGFINKSGKVVIPLKYDDVGGFSGSNIAPVKLNGKWGCIDFSGNEVIPLKYDDVAMNNNILIKGSSSFGFREGVMAVKLEGKWGYVDEYGIEVVPMIYDEVATFVREGMAPVRINDKWGYVSINFFGSTVISPKYDEVEEFFEDMTAVKLNNKWGYIDKSGKEIITFKYDEAKEFYNGFAAVKLGDKWGYIDKTGKQVVPFIYEGADYFSKNLAAVKKDGKWGFINGYAIAIVKPRGNRGSKKK